MAGVSALADGLDDLDELFDAVAVAAGELYECFCLRDHGAAFGGACHGDAAAAAEFEEPFIP